MAGRPDLMAGRKSLTVYEGMTGMMENAFINVKNQSHDDHRRRGDSRGRRERRDPRPGRPLRRLEPLRQGRQAGLHLQLGRAAAVHGQRDRGGSRRARRRSRSSSPTTATAAARAAPPRSSSTARKWPRRSKDAAEHFSADEARTSAWTADAVTIQGRDSKFTGKIGRRRRAEVTRQYWDVQRQRAQDASPAVVTRRHSSSR